MINGCIKRERKYQKKLYDTYASLLYAICLRYLKNTDDAKDALQDSFVKIYEKIASFKSEGSFEGWLKKTSVNVCLMMLRDRKKMQFIDKDEFDQDWNLSDENQTDNYEGISPQKLFALIQELPEGFRTIFNLYVLDGFTHKEIGEQLSISEGTSKSQLARAKKQLRDKINLTIMDNERYGQVI